MMKTRYLNVLIGLLVGLGCAGGVHAQSSNGDRAAAIRDALRSGGRYTASALLDEQGKARGDYDILDGRWKEYFPDGLEMGDARLGHLDPRPADDA